MIDIEVLKKTKKEIKDKFFAKNPNIIGVGIGKKIVGGKETDEICVRVYVKSKMPEEILKPEFVLPKEIEIMGRKIKIDVIEMETPKAFDAYTHRVRPLMGGYSVGHKDITAGTIGAFVKASDGKPCILSNNHVLANNNLAKIGDAILQPGPVDGGSDPADRVATLKQFVPIKTISYSKYMLGSYTEADINQLDCALGEILPGIDYELRTAEYEYPHTVVEPSVGMLVKKCGRTTGFTHGRITDISLDVAVAYGSGKSPPIGLMEDQIMIVSTQSGASFSAGGDSGSGIVLEDGSAMVGLLFAGSGTETIANRISLVLNALGASLL